MENLNEMFKPIGWHVRKHKSFLKPVSIKNHGDAEVLSLYREYGVLPKDSRDDNRNVTSLDTDSYKYVEKGQLVVNKMKAWQGSMGVSDYNGIISPAYYVFQITDSGINKKFLNYSLRNVGNVPEYRRLSAGLRTGQWDLSQQDFLSMTSIFPEIEEQEKIVEYLDRTTKEMDFLISETTDSIKELRAYKLARISELVSQGMDEEFESDADYIDYLGKVPKNWRIIRLKNIMRPVSVKHHGDEEVLSLYRDYGVIPKNSRDDNWNVTSLDTDSYKFVMPGQFVMNKMKAWQGSMAVSKIQGIISPAYHVFDIVRDNVDLDFLHYSLRAYRKIPAYRRLSAGMRDGQWDLSVEDFLGMKIALPDVQTQNLIVKKIEEFSPAIDKIISDKEKLVAELQAYKKSVIYEVVTGKKKV